VRKVAKCPGGSVDQIMIKIILARRREGASPIPQMDSRLVVQ
jgi:hypothetical protein